MLDVLKDELLGLLTRGWALTINGLFLQARKETLRHRVIPAFAFSAHALCQLVLGNHLAKRLGTVLAALIRVDHLPAHKHIGIHGHLVL